MSVIPADGAYTDEIHARNLDRYAKAFVDAAAEPDLELRAKDMCTIRRQLMLYPVVFPGVKANLPPTEQELELVLQAKSDGRTGHYISALTKYIEGGLT
jgi:hypothetical protein